MAKQKSKLNFMQQTENDQVFLHSLALPTNSMSHLKCDTNTHTNTLHMVIVVYFIIIIYIILFSCLSLSPILFILHTIFTYLNM